MRFLRYILFPVVPFYFIITWVINKCYDFGFFNSKSYGLPVICVGNLSVGGTGKTPMIEYIIKILKSDYKIATLSRGYKRKSNGFVKANANTSVEVIGDEPYQFFSKFGDVVTVAVDANRQNGIAQLMEFDSSLDVILLDDAFQHRKVKAGLNILLTTYSNLYCDDFVLPTGNLREPRAGAKRANIVVVTKCPITLTTAEKERVSEKLKLDSNQSLFFGFIEYSNVVHSVFNTKNITDFSNFTLVTGIANASPLVSFLEQSSLKFKHLEYKDHHFFSGDDIAKLAKQELIITTEKDFMRLKAFEILQDKLYYLPIEVRLDKPELFTKQIKSFVN